MKTRERLIAVASELIRRKGYFGTCVNEVLAAVGVPKGSLYHHFPAGKDELIREAAIHGGRSHLRRYGEALKGKSVTDGLYAVIDAMATELRDPPRVVLQRQRAGCEDRVFRRCMEQELSAPRVACNYRFNTREARSLMRANLRDRTLVGAYV